MRTEAELFDAFAFCSMMMDQIDFELAKIAEEKRDLPRTVQDLKMAKRIIARMIDLLAWFMGHDNEFEKRVAAFRASLVPAEDEDRVQNVPDLPRVKITHITDVKANGNYRGHRSRSRRELRRRKPNRKRKE